MMVRHGDISLCKLFFPRQRLFVVESKKKKKKSKHLFESRRRAFFFGRAKRNEIFFKKSFLFISNGKCNVEGKGKVVILPFRHDMRRQKKGKQKGIIIIILGKE